MNAGGSQTPGSSGNGTPRRLNSVSVSENYRRDVAEFEERYPRLREANFFPNLESYMVVCDVEEDATHLDGRTWMVRTPEGMEPPVTAYFTYYQGHVTMQEVAEI